LTTHTVRLATRDFPDLNPARSIIGLASLDTIAGVAGLSERFAFAKVATPATERSEGAGVAGFEPRSDVLASLRATSLIRIPHVSLFASLRSAE
jgi:hypothetical protein